MHSAFYTGRLSHQRRRPVPHAFDYAVRYAWIDLAELDVVFRGRWLWSTRRPALGWLRRADYLGDPAVPLDVAVRDRVQAETGRRPDGPVRMLASLRTWGHCFNPVAFYYCYDATGERIETVVAEITNTPWDERHAYVLPAARGVRERDRLRFRFGKAFHVSPFMSMDHEYDWTFTEPLPYDFCPSRFAALLSRSAPAIISEALALPSLMSTTVLTPLSVALPRAFNVSVTTLSRRSVSTVAPRSSHRLATSTAASR